MPIKPGDPIPAATFKQLTASGIANIDTGKLLKGRKVVMFGLPGAYTPVCSASHLPGFVAKAAELKAQGVDEIVCISVNDPFVMQAWGKRAWCGGQGNHVGGCRGRIHPCNRTQPRSTGFRFERALGTLLDGCRQRRGENAQCRKERARPWREQCRFLYA